MDFIGVLPDEQLIFSFEVKYQLADPSQPPTELLDSATLQTKHNEEYISRVFGPMLSSGWRFIKVPIILQQDTPGTLDQEKVCPHCQKYIITSGSLNDLSKWFKQKGLGKMKSKISGITQGYVESLKMLELIITSVSVKENFSTWQRVVGSNYDKPIATGYTPIHGDFGWLKKNPTIKNTTFLHRKTTIDHISFDEAKYKFHDAQKLIFFSRLQLSLLNISRHLSLILWGDYGTGK